MLNLLDIVYEYQRLFHRERSLDIPLDPTERARFRGLERLLDGDYLEAASASRHRQARGTVSLPVQFTLPGGFGSGEIRNLSAGGMSVATSTPAKIGTRTILRVTNPSRGFEYVFPGRVVWAGGRVMGIGFDGLPSRAPFLMPPPYSWRGQLRFGPQRTRPLVA